MKAWWAFAIGGAAILAVTSSRSASASSKKDSSNNDWGKQQTLPDYTLSPISEISSDSERVANRVYAYETALVVEQNYGIEGLADFLDAVGYWESRYNPKASGDSGKSMGLYQLRYGSAFDSADGLEYLRDTPEGYNLLNEIVTSVLFATDHVMDAIKRSRTTGSNRPCGPGAGPGDFLSARRWWKYPSLVHDYCESNTTSKEIRERLEKALTATGHPHSLMYKQPSTSGWPGIKQALSDFNISI